MSKLTPAKIWGCKYLGKIGRFYRYMPNGYECNPLGGYFKFKKLPTRERVQAMFVNIIGFKHLVE